MPASHPALARLTNESWRDVHFANAEVRCTRYEVRPSSNSGTAALLEVGGAIQAVLQEAFDTNQPIRVPGGRWSLSNIGRPKNTLLDLANYKRTGVVPASWLNASVLPAGVSPMLVSASMTVGVVHRDLAAKGVALPTSGASDGQTFAGAIATGTHGADMKVGALHDTVLAVHLVVSPSRSVLVQAADGPLNGKAADTLGRWFGISCELLSDDQLFRAARVHLGSLGVMLNVIVAAVPLYYLSRLRTPHQDGASWRGVLRTRRPKNANGLHPDDPDYLQFIVNPYAPHPEANPRAWMISMRKLAFSGQAGVVTKPSDVSLKSDLADFLPALVSLFEHDIELPGNPMLRAITTAQLAGIYGSTTTTTLALPAAMFGPPDFLGIDFGPLSGASAEYVFDALQARKGVEVVLNTLSAQAAAANQYLGGIGIRFVKGSDAWLAPNAASMNCFVELQSLYTDELPAIHAAIASALTDAGIPFCGHWGQWPMNTPAVAQSWWGDEAIASWKAARADLLPTAKARKIFGSPILSFAGLT
jgi:hypothetical protein